MWHGEIKYLLLTGALMFAFWAGVALGEDSETEIVKRYLPLKSYVELTTRQVARFARDDQMLDVRFVSRYEGTARAPDREVSVGDKPYRIETALRFQNDIIGFIPRGHLDSKKTADRLERAQMVEVFGRIIGRRGGENYVLVERLLIEDEEARRPKSGYELTLRGTGRNILEIHREGRYTFEFPCRYQRDETERVYVVVSEVPRAEFQKRMEALQEDEGAEEVDTEESEIPDADVPEREYTRYNAVHVYQAIGDDRHLDARFSDSFARKPSRFPPEIRDREGRRVRIGGAFETRTGIFCLVPARLGEYVEKLDYLMHEMSVNVKGTTLRTMGGERMFLVDEFRLPDLTRLPDPDFVWLISVFSEEDEQPRLFYREGSYRLQFPCLFEENRQEIVQAELSAIQVIEMELERQTESQ